MDLVGHVLHLAGDQDLVGRAEIGAPVDLDVLVGEAAESVSSPSSSTTTLSTPGGKPPASLRPVVMVHRLGDAIERDSVRGAKAWMAVMPGITLVVEASGRASFSASRLRMVLS